MGLKEALADRMGTVSKGWRGPVFYSLFTEGSRGQGEIIGRNPFEGTVTIKDASGLIVKIPGRHIHNHPKK